MKTFAAVFAGLAIVLAPVSAFGETIRIATWNINNLNDVSGVPLRDRAPIRVDEDYERLKHYRDVLAADVIALQEMGNPAAVDRLFPPEEYEKIFSGRYTPENAPDIYTAIIVRKDSAVSIVEHGDVQDLQVAHADGGDTRRGVEALLEAGGERFWLLAVHLKSACFAKSLAPATDPHCVTLAKQMPPLEAWIDAKEQTGLPLVVTGDFNRKFDVHGQTDHLWAEIDDANPPGLNLWRVPFRMPSQCPTTREGDRENPIDFLVFNELAWSKVDQQSYFELLYEDEEAAELGNRLSDHCPRAVEIEIGL